MLPTNFDFLTAERPDLAGHLLFADFVNGSRPTRIGTFSILDELARLLPDIDSFTLAKMLALLVQRRVMRQVYVVLTPSGVYADGEYEDPRKIPDKVPDQLQPLL